MKIFSSRFGVFDEFANDFFSKKPSALGKALIQRLNSESRVLYPYVRKNFLNGNKDLRGKDEFVQISWDEATNLVSKILKENFDKFGAQSIYGECYYWGGFGILGWGRLCVRRMLGLLGGFVYEDGDYSAGAARAIMPYIFGSELVYEPPTQYESILKHCKNIVFWGNNALVTSKTSKYVPSNEHKKYFQDIKNSSIDVTCVDVYKNQTAKFFDANLLSIEPGTDSALMIGMCHYLYETNLYNKEFIDKYCVGFDEFKNYFLGKNDCVIKNIKWASKICNIDENKIIDLCNKLVSKPSLIIAGRSIQRQNNGEQSYFALSCLSAMIGQIGMDGCGFEVNLGYSGGPSIYHSPKFKSLPQPDISNYPKIPSSRLIDAILNPGKKIKHKGEMLSYPNIRVVYNACSSIFSRHQDINRAILAFEKLDAVITAEPFWTASAKFSDIVLPVAIEAERDDFEFSSDGKYLFASKKIFEPKGQSLSDFEICKKISEKMGLDFDLGKNEKMWLKEIYDEAKFEDMPSFNEFWQKGFYEFKKIKSDNYTRFKDFRNGKKLNTQSGKIELFSKKLVSQGYKGHCFFEPINKKSKFWLISPHHEFRLHSQLDNTNLVPKIKGKEICLINPEIAKEKNIQEGDVIKIFNERGEVLCAVSFEASLLKNVIILHQGAWYNRDKNEFSLLGSANILSKDESCSDISNSNTAHTCCVDFEKYIEE